jgi:hypothetical protein
MADMNVIMNIFRGDAFSTVSLTKAVERSPYNPIGLGKLNLFEPNPIKTKAVAVYQWQGKLQIIPTSGRGSPAMERIVDKRQARYFETPRLFHGDTIQASELQDVVDFENPMLLQQLQTEVARRTTGPTGTLANMEYTKERHRLSAIQGVLRDADDTVLFNWFAEFGITPPAEVVMSLATSGAGTLRPIANTIQRGIIRASQGAFIDGVSKVWALCGDAFFDAFTNHPDVRTTYLNWMQAQQLRDSNEFSVFRFYDINWYNYRGSDDKTTIAIPTNKAQFFLKDAPGVFQVAWGPGETFDWVNKLGQPNYVLPIIDRDRNSWWRHEVYSYPLHICTRPETLWTATMDGTAD